MMLARLCPVDLAFSYLSINTLNSVKDKIDEIMERYENAKSTGQSLASIIDGAAQKISDKVRA
jgi:hypothetical protein